MKKLYTVITIQEGEIVPRIYYIELRPSEDLINEMDFRFGILNDEIYFVFEGHIKNLDPETLK